MIERRIEEITVDDLNRLCANGVSEGRSLEYKEALAGGTDSDKKEFLADVSSFANATGGDLLYGVKEARDQGKPTGLIDMIEGLAVANRDAELQRLENMLRDGVAPRIPAIRFRWIEGFAKGPALIVRIPRSWAGPHMVAFQQSSRFFSRNSNGKYQLDVFELRSAFLGSGSLSERAREFRAERLGRILADDAPLSLASRKIICVHGIPHAALGGAIDIDVNRPLDGGGYALIYPYGASGFRATSFNIDGVLAFDRTGNANEATHYLQLFRNGVVESVDAAHIEVPARRIGDGIGGLGFAERTFAFVGQMQKLWRLLEVEPPMSIFVSVVGARGALLFVSQSESGAFDREQLLLPELLLTDADGDPTDTCKPLLDVLWQAAGFPRCTLYSDAGKWLGRSAVR